MSGSRELSFIEYYIPRYRNESADGVTLDGAYGPRLFGDERDGHNQMEQVVRVLAQKPGSRRAVLQVFSGSDIARTPRQVDVPCTCTLQFLLRNGALHLVVYMRSSDVVYGLVHDTFAFTMLQEYMANRLSAAAGRNVALGKYVHIAGSLHYYLDCQGKVDEFLAEGFQSTSAMPAMPAVELQDNIFRLLEIEGELRMGGRLDPTNLGVHPYWADLARLLMVYQLSREKDQCHGSRRQTTELTHGMNVIRRCMSSRYYDQYINGKAAQTMRARNRQESLPLGLE
jgi:thymidylate synthase